MLVKTISTILMAILLSACALDPYDLRSSDNIIFPRPSTPTFLKSLRCEMITFLVQNRLRAIFNDEHIKLARSYLESKDQRYKDEIALVRRYPYINLDSSQHAFIQADLKNIESFSGTVGANWRFVAAPGLHSNTPLFGPSYNQTRTFETIEPIVLPQYADFGPLKFFGPPEGGKIPPISKFTKIYLPHPAEDEGWFCYGSLYGNGSTTLEDAINDTYLLMINDPIYRSKVAFERIYVDGTTMAQWLMSKSQDMAEAYNYPVHTNYESMIPGQLQYNFTLDVKPGIEIKDSIIGKSVTPFSIDLNASYDHSSAFSIIFNTPYAVASNSAKQGNTCVFSIKAGLCTDKDQKPLGLGSRLESLPERYDLSVSPRVTR